MGAIGRYQRLRDIPFGQAALRERKPIQLARRRVGRLHLLPREKIEAELIYLQIAIDKTAGERELEAWGWLQAKIADFYAGKV